MGDHRGQYPRELWERTVRLVPEPRERYESEWAAMASIAARLGIGTTETPSCGTSFRELAGGVSGVEPHTSSADVTIGKGSMFGNGLYAARDFKEGEIVIRYELKKLTFAELKALSPEDYAATHNVSGQIYLYPVPARYISHSDDPNVWNDHEQQADIARRDIKAGELITVDARHDDVPVLRRVGAILVNVPTVEQGLDFYREQLGMHTVWRREGAAAVRLGESELVLTTEHDPRTDLLVDSVEDAVAVFVAAGGKAVVLLEDTSAGRVAVVQDPFGNRLTLVDLSKGLYQKDA